MGKGISIFLGMDNSIDKILELIKIAKIMVMIEYLLLFIFQKLTIVL
ncbi:hypothetical protein JTT01_01775 [Clostridium botulinum]|nr:hypothetical protein [Clostridium botulinum]MCS4463509.1 hypothetical protein [Clostridium botulinum]MCS4469451.1 hypothetical protein [Clostridium botulinum]MCS4477923.1 hypothetical protein [Clostridium botulinum]